MTSGQMLRHGLCYCGLLPQVICCIPFDFKESILIGKCVYCYLKPASQFLCLTQLGLKLLVAYTSQRFHYYYTPFDTHVTCLVLCEGVQWDVHFQASDVQCADLVTGASGHELI